MQTAITRLLSEYILHLHHRIHHVQAGKIALQAGGVNRAMIHLKHRKRQILCLVTACQAERMTLIRPLPLVSAVIENHLQFAPDIEIARGKSPRSVWCDDHYDLSSRQGRGGSGIVGGGRDQQNLSAREAQQAEITGLPLKTEHDWGCVHAMHETKTAPVV